MNNHYLVVLYIWDDKNNRNTIYENILAVDMLSAINTVSNKFKNNKFEIVLAKKKASNITVS